MGSIHPDHTPGTKSAFTSAKTLQNNFALAQHSPDVFKHYYTQPITLIGFVYFKCKRHYSV